jgi:tellurite resistance protein
MANNTQNYGCLITIGIGLMLLAFIGFSDGAVGLGFFLLIISIILIAVANSNKGSNTPASAGSGSLPPPMPNHSQLALQLKITTKIETIQGTPFNLLKFHTKGIFSSHQRIARPCFEFRLSDVTDTSISDGAPILSVIDDLQDDNSTEFRFRQILPQPLDAGSGSIDWVEFCSVPKELLVFPITGNRKIKVILRVTDAVNGLLVSSVSTLWTTSVVGVGYLEMEDEESEAQAASLQLAMCIAAADGHVDNEEVKVIKGWGERTVNSLPNPRQAARRSILNEALQTATREIRARRISNLESDAIHILKSKEEPRFLYDAYELCLNVLKADGEAHPEEMAQLTRIARKLDLDESKVRILTDRHLADVEFAPIENETEDDHILGITSEMSKDQIRKHLNKLYQKHQARTQHDNPDIIAKSKEWLERIARARVRHLG